MGHEHLIYEGPVDKTVSEIIALVLQALKQMLNIYLHGAIMLNVKHLV